MTYFFSKFFRAWENFVEKKTIRTIRIQIGKNYWDLETYLQEKLEKYISVSQQVGHIKENLKSCYFKLQNLIRTII